MTYFQILSLAATTYLLVGCGTTAVERDYGKSVANMIANQQAHPEISRNPDPDVVDGTDAERVVRVLKTYREDVSKPEEVDQGVTINIGN